MIICNKAVGVEFNTSSHRLQIKLKINILFVKTDLRFCKITIFYDIRNVNKCQWVFRTPKVAMRVSNSYIKKKNYILQLLQWS